jgi:hypothetical protein
MWKFNAWSVCLASYGNAEALEVAGALDNKVEGLLLEAAQ